MSDNWKLIGTIEYHMHCKKCGQSYMQKRRVKIVTLWYLHTTAYYNSCEPSDVDVFWAMGNRTRKLEDHELRDMVEFMQSNGYKLWEDMI